MGISLDVTPFSAIEASAHFVNTWQPVIRAALAETADVPLENVISEGISLTAASSGVIGRKLRQQVQQLMQAGFSIYPAPSLLAQASIHMVGCQCSGNKLAVAKHNCVMSLFKPLRPALRCWENVS